MGPGLGGGHPGPAQRRPDRHERRARRAYITGQDRQPSLDRAARWDGLLPAVRDRGEHRDLRGPAELADLVGMVRQRRDALGTGGAPYDVVLEADSTGEFMQLSPADPAEWAAAGATWWVESWWSVPPGPEGLAEVRRRVQAGPPASA